MADLITTTVNLPTQFDPTESRLKDSIYDLAIEHAKRIKDWPALEAAIEGKIEQQVEFVGWWRMHVSVNHSGDRSKSADRGTCFSLSQAEEATGIRNQTVSKWARRLSDREAYKKALYGVAWKMAMGDGIDPTTAQLIVQSKSTEWFTPQRYVESARKVLGGIDLDPASCAEANKVVQADTFYSVDEDGLETDWFGRIWLNPPYGEACSAFVAKLCAAYDMEEIDSAILLVNSNSTDTAWFAPLWDQVLCFTSGRINFWSVPESSSGPTHGSCFVYFGNDQEGFIREFSEYGAVVRKVTAGNESGLIEKGTP
jgi:phage N-6-adenine-methyltransferase